MQFITNERDKFTQSDEYKAYCAKKCALAKVKIWDRIKQSVIDFLIKQKNYYTELLLDELMRLLAPYISIFNNLLGIYMSIAAMSWDDVLDYLGITDLEEAVKAKIITIIKLYEKLLGQCDCDGATGPGIAADIPLSPPAVTSLTETPPATEISANVSSSATKSAQGLPTLNAGIIAKEAPSFTPGFNKEGTGAPELLQKAEYAMSESMATTTEYAMLAAENLVSYDLATMRETSRYLRSMHPSVVDKISVYPLTQPMCEYTGAWAFTFDPDKAQLGIEDWGKKAVSTRACYELKLPPNQLRRLREFDETTNTMLYEGLSKEYRESEKNVSKYVYLGLAHGIHLAGDVTYHTEHMRDGTVGKLLATTEITKSLGEMEFNLNYKNPVIWNVKVNSSPTMIEAAGSMIKVDKRLNMITEPFAMLDDKGLQ